MLTHITTAEEVKSLPWKGNVDQDGLVDLADQAKFIAGLIEMCDQAMFNTELPIAERFRIWWSTDVYGYGNGEGTRAYNPTDQYFALLDYCSSLDSHEESARTLAEEVRAYWEGLTVDQRNAITPA